MQPMAHGQLHQGAGGQHHGNLSLGAVGYHSNSSTLRKQPPAHQKPVSTAEFTVAGTKTRLIFV
jgi:hypothetical protein